MDEEMTPAQAGWRIDCEGRDTPIILDPENNAIAALAPSSEEKMLARASLLMAAPYLYEAVTTALDIFQMFAEYCDENTAQTARTMAAAMQGAVDHANSLAPVSPYDLVGP